MDEVTRRNAIKLAAIAGVVTVAATATADDKKGASAGKDGNPANWGADGDQAFKITQGNTPVVTTGRAGILSDNCDEVKGEIKKRFQVYDFGDCDHPTPVDADVEAAGKCLPKVIANGGVINTEFGHRTVKHKVNGVTFNTYLAYAGADRP